MPQIQSYLLDKIQNIAGLALDALLENWQCLVKTKAPNSASQQKAIIDPALSQATTDAVELLSVRNTSIYHYCNLDALGTLFKH
jgi:hypothetical protein